MVYFPSGGFLLSAELGGLGGVDALGRMCLGCPANTSRPTAAGCAGHFYQPPGSEELETQLRAAADRLGLSQQVAEEFPNASRLWYALWIKSPLSPSACWLLGPILEDLIQQDIQSKNDPNPRHADRIHSELQAFIRATHSALKHDLKLHVSMAPPGHTDFGFYTVFPHCPVCKAQANIECWQKKYPSEMHRCHVCHAMYSPAATASSIEDPMEQDSLHDKLGVDRFREFSRSFLISRGYSAVSADAILKAVDASEAFRQQKAREHSSR